MNRAGKAIAVGAGVLVVGGGLAFLLLRNKGASASNSALKLTFNGYALSGSPSTLHSSLSVPQGQAAIGELTLTSSMTAVAQFGVRGYLLQAGDTNPQQYVTGAASGTVVGHFFAVTSAESDVALRAGEPNDLVASVSLNPGQSVTIDMYAAIVNASSIPGTFGVLWVAGPLATVESLPAVTGQLPADSTLIYLMQQNVVTYA